MRLSRVVFVAGVVPALASTFASPLGAQGSLAQQGFGYPMGLSARSIGTASALGEIDPQTPLNPAAIVLAGRSSAYAQYDPEFRTVTVGGVESKTTTGRFPMFTVTGHTGPATFALSFSSLLDRTWSNTYADTQVVGGTPIASTVVTQSQGGIADASAAMAWSFSEKVHIGAALHVYPGQNRVTAGRNFVDTNSTGNFAVTNNYAFSGAGLSLGAVVQAMPHLVLSGDVRAGGDLTMRLGDSTVIGKGKVPFRFGLSAAYDGIAGAIFAVRLGSDKWSDLAGLGSSSLGAHDATDLSVGTEIAGPRISDVPVLLRAGFRTRGLPFTWNGSAVNETSFAGGVGIPIVGARAILDLSVAHASRESGIVRERSLSASIGVGIRP